MLILSSIIGYVLGSLNSFYFGRTWVFGRSTEYSLLLLLKFSAIYIYGLLFMTSIIEVSTNHYNFDYKLSWIFAAIVVFINNFVGTRVLFKKK